MARAALLYASKVPFPLVGALIALWENNRLGSRCNGAVTLDVPNHSETAVSWELAEEVDGWQPTRQKLASEIE